MSRSYIVGPAIKKPQNMFPQGTDIASLSKSLQDSKAWWRKATSVGSFVATQEHEGDVVEFPFHINDLALYETDTVIAAQKSNKHLTWNMYWKGLIKDIRYTNKSKSRKPKIVVLMQWFSDPNEAEETAAEFRLPSSFSWGKLDPDELILTDLYSLITADDLQETLPLVSDPTQRSEDKVSYICRYAMSYASECITPYVISQLEHNGSGSHNRDDNQGEESGSNDNEPQGEDKGMNEDEAGELDGDGSNEDAGKDAEIIIEVDHDGDGNGGRTEDDGDGEEDIDTYPIPRTSKGDLANVGSEIRTLANQIWEELWRPEDSTVITKGYDYLATFLKSDIRDLQKQAFFRTSPRDGDHLMFNTLNWISYRAGHGSAEPMPFWENSGSSTAGKEKEAIVQDVAMDVDANPPPPVVDHGTGDGKIPKLSSLTTIDAPSPEKIAKVATFLCRKNARVLAIVGAGISVAAQLPIFRGTTALAVNKDLFTLRYLQHHRPKWEHEMYQLRLQMQFAQPTATHELLKFFLDKNLLQTVYTTNIDGLEQRAGLTCSEQVDQVLTASCVQLHGCIHWLRCSYNESHIITDGTALYDTDCPQCVETRGTRSRAAARRTGKLTYDVALDIGPNPRAQEVKPRADSDCKSIRGMPTCILIMGSSMRSEGARKLTTDIVKTIRDSESTTVIWVNTDEPPSWLSSLVEVSSFIMDSALWSRTLRSMMEEMLPERI
ncbi:hypothetical protein FRC03_009109 [Tulasnella sp. 419]|nr:hypothetical protein FRC02_011683 [Tulasnella sp. 418]KAG8958458.1 hypothetical protein FRC03_009109 [Tulasnella sp. 419]